MMRLVAMTMKCSSRTEAGSFCHPLGKIVSSQEQQAFLQLLQSSKRRIYVPRCFGNYHSYRPGLLNSRLLFSTGYALTLLSSQRTHIGLLSGSRTLSPGLVSANARFIFAALSKISSDVHRPVASNPAEQSPMRQADEKFMRAIMFEASKGYVNATGKLSRFDEFLQAQLAALVSRHDLRLRLDSSHLLQGYVDASRSYDQLTPSSRLQLLDGVVQIWGFRGVQDMVAFQEANQDLNCAEKQLEEQKLCDLVSKRDLGDSSGALEALSHLRLSSHPAIVFGSSDPVELYDPGRGGNDVVMPASQDSSPRPRSRETVTLTGQDMSVDDLMKKKKNKLQSVLDRSSTKSEPARAGPRVGIRAVDLVMQHENKNASKNKVGGVSSWDDGVLRTLISKIDVLPYGARSRLEENGFHTVRLLLHHVPRTYVNFEQAEGVIENGKHVFFTGKIWTSKGVALNPTLGLVEVVVRSVSEKRLKDSTGPADCQGPDDDVESSVMYLHLKRFYRGPRYATRGFLDRMSSMYSPGASVTVSGKVKAMDEEYHYEIKEFILDIWKESNQDPGSNSSSEVQMTEVQAPGKPHPVYSAKGDLQPKTIGQWIKWVLQDLPSGFDPLPEKIRRRFNLLELHQAYVSIHAPASLIEAEQARERLVFDEFFYLQLAMLLNRQQVADGYLAAAGLERSSDENGSLDMEKWSPLTLKMVRSLPYDLTVSQKKALSEILWDVQSPVPMSRLLQGDVGCGKTIVAFLALLEVIDAGYQGALMAPTEFLANQHYQRIVNWLNVIEESERPCVALLTGSTPLSKARAIRSGLANGEIALAIGTHSLLSESVKFAALGLAVIDEQHRFGVDQRGRLHSKGPAFSPFSGFGLQSAPDPDHSSGKLHETAPLCHPHILAMSATPIPRSLALAMHGDLALSQITELPPGRPPISTHVFANSERGRREAYKLVAEELEAGGRAFFVFPVIESSELLPDVRAATAEFGNLEKLFSGFKCGLVHGRMKPQEKDAAVHLFKTGETQVLVSTTVIEVGIDIPEASVMVIEHADRYGMAQLHQLRGRVGRGSRKSICILLGSSNSLGRLKLLEKSRDGFYLAEVDLESRGPGELLGKRQSGNLPEFSIARIETDGRILQDARAAAEEVLKTHHGLEGLPLLKRELSMRRPPVLD